MTTTCKDIEQKYPQTSDSDDECELCHVHAKAYDYFEAESATNAFFECPWCGERVPYYYGAAMDRLEVVGESNRGAPEEKMYLAPVDECSKCRKHFALLPEKIQLNGNHDVYYTGGRDYLVEDRNDELELRKRIEDHVLPHIEDYTQRLKPASN